MNDRSHAASLSDFTREEFREYVRRGIDPAGKTQEEADAFIVEFNKIVPHPAKSDLIFWPEAGADPSPEGVTSEIERYCREHDLPAFSDS